MKHIKLKFKLKTAMSSIMLLAILSSVFPVTAASNDTVTVSTAVAKSPEEFGYKGFYENKQLQIYTVTEGEYFGTFAIRNKMDNSVWYSNPTNAKEDSVSLNYTDLMSLFTLTYYNEEKGLLESVNSKMGSVDAGGLSIQALKKGLRFTFNFPDLKITLVLNILLNDDGSVSANIPLDKLEEKGTAKVFQVKLLPYFCSASKEDSGYILLPDGSGAVMKLNNNKTAYGVYSRPVYGGDVSDILDIKTENAEQVYMPVYGLLKNNSAMFAVITEGAAQSTITAMVSGIDSDQNTAYNTFYLRAIAKYSLDQGWQGKKSFNVYQDSAPKLETMETRYYFLNGEDASLSGMAKTYQKYLTGGKTKLKEPSASVYLDFVGAVSKKKSVFGFPGTAVLPITTFDQSITILESLKKEGIDSLNVRYLEWDSKSVRKKIVSSTSPEGVLGGVGDYKKLLNYTKENKIGFFPDVDPLHFTKTDYPFQEYFDASRNFNNQINKYYPFKLNLFTKDTAKGYEYSLSLSKLKKTSSSFLSSFNKLGTDGLSLSAIGSTVTSDFSGKNGAEAFQGEKTYSDIIKKLSEGKKLLLDCPNISAVSNATHIVNMPESSGFDMTDYRVPFYHMVVSGLVSYTGRAINLDSDTRIAFLKCLETGGSLHYALSYRAESSIVKNTAYDYLISADYSQWTKTIQDQYEEMKRVYKALGSQILVSYEVLAENVVKSEFSSGASIIINYSSAPVTAENNEVAPQSYLLVQGGKVIEP